MEYLDIVDENGLPTGQIIERTAAHATDAPHRTAHVWIIRRRGDSVEVLMQKRSMNKDSFPGQYDTSSAGHIPAGVEPLPSALREMQEELGLTAAPEELTFAGTFLNHYKSFFHGKPFRDNEYSLVYVYDRPVCTQELTLQAEELERVDWFELRSVYEARLRNDPAFCVPIGGLETLMRFLGTEPADDVKK